MGHPDEVSGTELQSTPVDHAELDANSESTVIDDVQSTVSAVAARARPSSVVLTPVEHDDIPKTAADSSPSTVTKSTPAGDVAAESLASVSTAPSSVSDHGESKPDVVEQKGTTPIQNQTIKEHPEEEGSSNIVPNSLIKDSADVSDASKSDGSQRLSSDPKRSTVGPSKVAFTSPAKDPSPAFPSPNTAAALSRSSTPASHSSSSLKRISTSSTQFSSNKAESGSDVSSHRTNSSLQDPVGFVPPEELLQKTGNEHLSNNVSSAAEFNADESFRPALKPTVTAVAKSTSVPDADSLGLQHRREYPAGFSSNANAAEKAQEGPKKKHWTRRKLLYTGLALMAMATIALRPRLPPK